MKSLLSASLAMLLLPLAATGQPGPPVNGLKTNARIFNDFSTTTLQIVNGNSVNLGTPSSVTIQETAWTDDGSGGNFANRHDVTLSGNAGATSQTFGIDASFTVSARVTLSVGSAAPRKEAGIRINSPSTGDAEFLVNSDAGEIVAFGGGAPFKLFGSNGGGNGYVPGTEILMGIKMTGGGDGIGGVPDTIEYFIDRGMGFETSGPLAWTNPEAGPVNYNVALYTQASPNLINPAEFLDVKFDHVAYANVVPGDFNGDGAVDLTDYLILSTNLFTDVSGLTPEQAYLQGDVTADLLINGNDVRGFRFYFDDANGVGAFVAMLAAIPEPSTAVLAALGLGTLWRRRRPSSRGL